MHVPRAHEVKYQRVIAKTKIIKYGQDVIIQIWTDDNIQYLSLAN